jgi:hypothetical protein
MCSFGKNSLDRDTTDFEEQKLNLFYGLLVPAASWTLTMVKHWKNSRSSAGQVLVSDPYDLTIIFIVVSGDQDCGKPHSVLYLVNSCPCARFNALITFR